MSRKIIAVRPADLNPDEVEYFQVGTLLVNTLEGDLYIVLDKEGNGVKKAYLVGGSAKYEILHHASLSHVIQNFDPVKFDYSTVWYNTDMMYVKPLDGINSANAYITVRAELSPGVFGWKTILPISSAKNVYITKKDDGTPYTLQNYIDDHAKTLISPPNVEEAERGEIYIKEDNTLWWKTGESPQDQVILGDANPYVIEKLKKSIHIMRDHPANWDPQSLWLKEGTDAGIVDALSTLVYASDPLFTGGLKFAEHTNKTGIAKTAYGKIATIDLNLTQETGFQLLNYEFGTKGKYYMEFYIEDKEDALKLLFFNKRPEDSLSDFGNQLDQASMFISSKVRKISGVEYATDFGWNKKTIFVMVDTEAMKLSAGFVLDDGTLSYVYKNNITYITKFIGIGTGTSTKANTKVIVKIRSFKVSEIPLGFKGLNNVLPDETAFTNIAPVTNAQSVFLEKNQSLNALHQGGGRLITTPRDYKNKNSSVPGELMTDYEDEILYAKKPDGTIFKIGGGNDDTFIKHVSNSMMVIHGDLNTTVKEDDNLSKVYFLENDISSKITDYRSQNNVLLGSYAIIDNSPDGNEEYKITIPYTDTTTAYHTWNDIRSNANRYDKLKVYLDDINEILRDNLKTKFVYRGFEEIISKEDLISRFNTRGLFFVELMQNNSRFSPNSIYLQSIKRNGENNVASKPELSLLYNLFNVPENGSLTIFKDEKNKIYITLYSESGNEYLGNIMPNYEIRWDKKVAEKGGVVNLTSNLITTGNISASEVSAEIGTFQNKIDTPLISFNGKKILTASVNSDGKSVIALGDENTKSSNIKSVNRPIWTTQQGSETKEYNFAMIEDMVSSWRYKGELFTSNNLIDLNTLNIDNNIGYYLLSSPESKKLKNYPEDNKKGYLYVMKTGNLIIQTFVNIDDDKTEYCTRSFNGTTWTKWNKTLVKEDLSNFYEKTGGPINGNVGVGQNLSVAGTTSLNGDLVLKSAPVINSVDGKSILSTENVNGNIHFNFGNIQKYEKVNLLSSTVPAWSTEVVSGTTKTSVKYNFALEKDLRALDDDTYSKSEVDDLISKIDFTPINNAIKERLKKTGDTGTGNYTFNDGEVTVENLNLTNGMVRFPSLSLNTKKPYRENLIPTLKGLYSQDKVKKGITLIDDLYTSTKLRPETGVSTVVISNDVSERDKPNNRVSSILLNVSSDDGISIGTVTGMNPETLSFRRLVERNDIVDNLNSIDAYQVLSANQGRILYSMNISRYRGFMKLFYQGTSYDSDKLYTLEPGNYNCSEETDLVKLGLDVSKITVPGTLIVNTNNTTTGKVFTYLPYTDKTVDKNTLAFMNMNSSNKADSKWIYVKDYSLFVDKNEMTVKLKKLRDSILGYVVSPKFSYTGNTINTSLPYRLVHIHNNAGSPAPVANTLRFFTNIGLSESSLNANDAIVQIKIRGYSLVDSSPIEIISSAVLTNKTNTTINENSSDITYLTPGGVEVSLFIDDTTKTLGFTVFNEKGNTGLTFDTYIRINGTTNLDFEPAVVKCDYDSGNPQESIKVNTESSAHLFSN